MHDTVSRTASRLSYADRLTVRQALSEAVVGGMGDATLLRHVALHALGCRFDLRATEIDELDALVADALDLYAN